MCDRVLETYDGFECFVFDLDQPAGMNCFVSTISRHQRNRLTNVPHHVSCHYRLVADERSVSTVRQIGCHEDDGDTCDRPSTCRVDPTDTCVGMRRANDNAMSIPGTEKSSVYRAAPAAFPRASDRRASRLSRLMR